MAWMTCCPSCRTTFRVTPEQLSQAQAWLRCGHCDRVFDGTGLVVNWQGAFHAAAAQEPVVDQDALEPIGFEQAPSAQAKGLWAAALLLLCVLPLLLIVSQRQAVLARWPQLWPAFNQVCALARCDVPPLVRAQDVVIDSSSFVPQAEGYALAAVLRNVGAWPVRAPALELTLLDAQEQAVLRRVFTPEQLQFAQELVPEQTVEVRLEFLLDAGTPEVTGYRLRSVQP
jgi:predicted Zn finger-like uncharacterized protein